MIWVLVLIGLIVTPSAPFALRSWRSRSLAPLWEAGRGMVAGVVAGVVWAVGARAAMRAVALTAGDPTEFSLSGTAFILLTGCVLGSVLGLIFASVRRWLPGSAAGQGVTFGAFPLALQLALVAVFGFTDVGAVEAVGGILFGALFLVFGLVLGLVVGRLEGSRTDSAAGGDTRAGTRDECVGVTAPRARPVLWLRR